MSKGLVYKPPVLDELHLRVAAIGVQVYAQGGALKVLLLDTRRDGAYRE